MKSDFETYMLDKIDNSFFMEKDLNEAILSLYKKGYLKVIMQDGEPMITISDAGKSVYASLLLSSMSPVAEA
tara:strand:+ start:2022 stop:2237 length:216 start_codon:yes stop_codon:yes gene_type:complete